MNNKRRPYYSSQSEFLTDGDHATAQSEFEGERVELTHQISLYLTLNREVEMVVGEGFEPSKSVTADLQSAPFGRSGTPPGT